MGRLPGRPQAGARATASARPCSTSPAPRPTTSRCATGRSSRLQAERIRPVPRSTTGAGRRRDRGGHLRGARPRVDSRRSCVRTAARSQRPHGRPLPVLVTAGRPARRPAHAHDGDGRPRRRRDHGAAAASRRARATSRSPITARRWRWRTASTSTAPWRTPRAIRALERAARRHHAARGHRMRHPAGRLDGSRRRLPGAAGHRHRLGALGVQPGPAADDRSAAARYRLPVGRRPRPPDRPADPEARGISRRHRAGARRARRLPAWRSRSTASPIDWIWTTRTRGSPAIAGSG